jgi:hypothetical protein
MGKDASAPPHAPSTANGPASPGRAILLDDLLHDLAASLAKGNPYTVPPDLSHQDLEVLPAGAVVGVPGAPGQVAADQAMPAFFAGEVSRCQ